MKIDYIYLIRSKNSYFSPVYTTKAQAKKYKSIIFTNKKDYEEAWIQELVVALPDKIEKRRNK